MRSFQLDVPIGIVGASGPEIQSEKYSLCAVVRMGSPELEINDDARTYWENGKEIMPPEIGAHFKSKDSEAKAERRWSLMDRGEYILFYYRVEEGKDGPPFPMNLIAPEFEERPWVIQANKAMEEALRNADDGNIPSSSDESVDSEGRNRGRSRNPRSISNSMELS